jgi:rSAM/selenodomain-associated transferase 1
VNAELLIIMARYPTRGKVKTRLAAQIGKTAAWRVYRQLLAHHAREFARAPFEVEWRHTPARAPFGRWLRDFHAARSRTGSRSHKCHIRAQPDGELGERMRLIFEQAFARGYRRVVMIGTDAPQMGQGTVKRALRLLRRQRAVIQPTEDGGYALIGLAGMADVFTGMAWSTERLMAQTRRRLRRLRIRFAELPPTYDVDTAADWARCRVGKGLL